jgi:hypothetical protein
MSGTPKKRAIARFAVLLLFLGYLVAVLLFALSSPTRTVQLSGGSTLELLGVSQNEPPTNLTLQLACPKTVTTEFYVKPGD